MKGDRRVLVTGLGVLSNLGDSPEELFRNLCEQRSSLRPADTSGPTALPPIQVSRIDDFDAGAYLGKSNLRPLDRISRLVTVAAHLALKGAGWEADALSETEVGLVLSTVLAGIHTIGEFDRRALIAGPSYVKPMDFANTVLNAPAGQAAIYHKLRGVNATVAGGTMGGLAAVVYGVDLIRNGNAEAVLAGGADELSPESLHGLYRAGLLAGSNGTPGRPVPFDAGRNGFVPGEAAVLLMLEEAGAARRRGARGLAEISGYGTSFDPGRGRDARGATAVIRAIELALSDADADPGSVGAIASSANGSVLGDRSEAAGIAAALGAEAERVPVTAIQSMLGDTLAASGPLGVLTLIEALRGGTLPGIRGLEEVEPDFLLARATAESQPVERDAGLVTAIGLGGGAAAVYVSRRDA